MDLSRFTALYKRSSYIVLLVGAATGPKYITTFDHHGDNSTISISFHGWQEAMRSIPEYDCCFC